MSLEARESALLEAESELEVVAARWLDRRVCHRVASDLDAELTEAIQACRRAERRLRDTRKRLGAAS